MSQTVISVEHLCKTYRLGQIGTGTLRNDLNVWWAKKLGRPNPMLKIGQIDHGNRNGETLWALKDINLQVEQGEVLGIIGRNGAGKSTLLKILSRVTAPTSGCVKVKGRIASLLEVGTGFHPELTGRENVYLNGAILGMTKEEVSRKFDEILAFAEIEKFIDTPVKRYSSGMYVRLAFAVAANLESKILLVDEVLAVGDAEFQKKCLGKMGDVASKEGRTVLFVSHNMAAILQLCRQSSLISKGMLVEVGRSSEVVKNYLNSDTQSEASVNLKEFKRRRGEGQVRFVWARLQDDHANPTNVFSMGDNISLVFKTVVESSYQNQKIKYSVAIRTSDGIRICNSVTTDSGFEVAKPTLENSFLVKFEDVRFYPGTYYVSIWVGGLFGPDTYDAVDDCLSFDIKDSGNLATRSLPRSSGLIFITPEWKVYNE